MKCYVCLKGERDSNYDEYECSYIDNIYAMINYVLNKNKLITIEDIQFIEVEDEVVNEEGVLFYYINTQILTGHEYLEKMNGNLTWCQKNDVEIYGKDSLFIIDKKSGEIVRNWANLFKKGSFFIDVA